MSEEKRITFTAPAELKERFDQIPWGCRSPVMRKLAQWFCDIYEEHGDLAIGIVLSQEFELVSLVEQAVQKRLKGG